MAPFNGIPSHSEQVALALAPKFAATLSIIGSIYIIYDATLGRKRRQKPSSTSNVSNQTYHRLMIGPSTCDLLMSIGLFTSTWPMPRDTPNVWGAVGNARSCEVIGFLEQAGVAAVIYNASLSTYYLLRIRFGWPIQKVVKVEHYLHIVPIAVGLVTMIASLALNLFNSGIFDCWIAPYPQGCVESWQSPDGTTTCLRGNNASLYQWIFDLIPKWLSILVVTVNMVVIHRSVYLKERQTIKYTDPRSTVRLSSRNSNNASSNNLRMNENYRPPKLPVSRRLARQSYLYVGALYLTYLPVIITRATELIAGYVYYGMLLTISITIPLQGFWNVMIYLRPRWLRDREIRRRRKNQNQNTQREHSDTDTRSEAEANTFSRCLLTMCSVHNISHVVQEQVSAISHVVMEGGLENEEEDFDDDNIEISFPTDNSDEEGGDDFEETPTLEGQSITSESMLTGESSLEREGNDNGRRGEIELGTNLSSLEGEVK